MVAFLAPMLMAASLGQAAPAEAVWLKSIPADVAVVARVKALETGRDDLLKMLEAMSPNAAGIATPQIEQGLTIFSAQYTKQAVQNPFFVIARLPKDGPLPPWAVLIQASDYLGVVKAVSGKDDVAPKSLGGYDSFEKADGQVWYSAKGNGFVAFGADEDLIKSVAKPGSSLDEKISAEHKARLLGGDLGIYINAASLQTQYADQIDQAKQAFAGIVDQAGGQIAPNVSDMMKNFSGGMFDAIKEGDALTLNLDFATEGLNVSSFVTVKPGSNAEKSLKAGSAGPGSFLGKLPIDAASYAYLNLDSKLLAKLQKPALGILGIGGKTSPDLEKALALQAESGTGETYAAGSVGGVPTSNVSFTTPKDPAKAVEAVTLTLKAMKGDSGLIKDLALTPNAQTYKGFVLNEAKMTLDLTKLIAPGAPGGVEALKKLRGGETVTTWYGTDGKTVLSLAAPTFNDVKAVIDSTLAGKNSLGDSANYAALRKAFPADVNAIFVLNAQAMIKQIASQLGSAPRAEIKIPADMPKTPAFFGASFLASPKGLGLQLVVPSNVGPVIEKGLIPVLQGMQGQIQ